MRNHYINKTATCQQGIYHACLIRTVRYIMKNMKAAHTKTHRHTHEESHPANISDTPPATCFLLPWCTNLCSSWSADAIWSSGIVCTKSRIVVFLMLSSSLAEVYTYTWILNRMKMQAYSVFASGVRKCVRSNQITVVYANRSKRHPIRPPFSGATGCNCALHLNALNYRLIGWTDA